MRDHFAMFAKYNSWANERLFAAAARLSDADYRRDGGAFFGSVHRTLNHLLVTDRIWLKRFTGEGGTYDALDIVPFDDLPALRAARIAEDARIVGWIDGLANEAFGSIVRYRALTNPTEVAQPLASALAHLFNHQTHHRGQVHALLTAFGGRDAAPPLDLIYFQRETRIGFPPM
jgi:uncharacterized damage-inducible protein DinB